MLTPSVKATLFAPTPTRPTPAREKRSRRPGCGLPSRGSRSATSVRSRSPARVNLIVTKGKGGNSATAILTATGLVPRKRTARSSEASTRVAAPVLAPGHDPKSTVLAQRSPARWGLLLRSRVTVWSKISLPSEGTRYWNYCSGKGVWFDARSSSVSLGRCGPHQ